MSVRYLEIDSTYRDRVRYPAPASFVVQMAQSGQAIQTQALDPVCDASPVLVWNNTFVETSAANSITGITVNGSYPGLQGAATFQVTTVGPVPGPEGDRFRQVRNFYVGACLAITVAGVTTTRRITEYLPLDYHNAIITLESALPDSVIGLNSFHIDNPTPLPTDTPNAVIKVFIPGSNKNLQDERLQTFGLGGDNYYVGYYIQSQFSYSYKKIIAFDATTRLATLDSLTPFEDWSSVQVIAPFVKWGRNFSIRKEIPILGQLDAVLPNPFTFTTVRLSPDVLLPGSFNVISKLSTENNFYNGCFIRVPPIDQNNIGLPPYAPPQTEERRIIAYDAATYTFTVDPPFSSVNLPFFPNLKMEIELFTRDNATPFNFTGSLVTGDETSATYEVELLNLVLPNTTLASGRGGRAVFYPYLYVELQPVSSGAFQTRNIIYSNNPNSVKMLFRAVVDDTPIPVISPFVKIDGDGMVHTVKIRPNDSFRFSVYHANGDLFQTVIEDTYSPTAPNPLCQISACFAFRKVNNGKEK